MPDWAPLSTGMGAPGLVRQADGETETDRLNSFVLSNTHFLPRYKSPVGTEVNTELDLENFIIFGTEAASVTPEQKAAVKLLNT